MKSRKRVRDTWMRRLGPWTMYLFYKQCGSGGMLQWLAFVV